MIHKHFFQGYFLNYILCCKIFASRDDKCYRLSNLYFCKLWTTLHCFWICIYGSIICLNRGGGKKNFSDLEYLQNKDMVESYFLFWNWRRLFHVNLISFPIAMYSITIQCQENLLPNWEMLSLFFIFTDQGGTGEKIPRKRALKGDMKLSPVFWCYFKTIL